MPTLLDDCSDIEARLAKLDTEVAEIRTSAEQEAAAEEKRIKQAAEEDKQKVLQAVETEITPSPAMPVASLRAMPRRWRSIWRRARFALTSPTDHALVREFVDQLGKDGR